MITLQEFFSDPVLYLSFSVLGFIVLMMGYIFWMFYTKSSENEGKK